MKTRTNESGKRVFRKLSYFFENKVPVHFSLHTGGWKNGHIIDLSSDKLTMVLRERKEGELPILLEDIVLHSILPYKEVGK